jgi:hypothetical protein
MRIVSSLPVLLILLFQSAVEAQEPAIAPSPQPIEGQKTAREYYVEDGGAHGGVLESIQIPPTLKSPFTLVLETEWVRQLPDGGTITTVNKRRIARDAEGRVYEERWFLVPKDGKVPSQMSKLQISDPHAHTLYDCPMQREEKACLLLTYSEAPGSIYRFQGPPSGPLPDGAGETIHQDLGKQLISGLETLGTRDTVVFNPGLFGNDRKVSIEREFWFSPQLGFNLLSKRSDPRIGTQTFTVTNLILSDPDPKLFDLPEGFKVVDRRAAAPPQH